MSWNALLECIQTSRTTAMSRGTGVIAPSAGLRCSRKMLCGAKDEFARYLGKVDDISC